MWDDLFSGHGQAIIALDPQTRLYLLAAAVAGLIIGWLIRSWLNRRSLNKAGLQWQQQFDQTAEQNAALQSSLEAQQAAVQEHEQAAVNSQTEIDSLREKVNTLSNNLILLGKERDGLREKLPQVTDLVKAAKQRIMEQHEELTRVGNLYRGQVQSATEQRTALERKIDHDKSENESLRNLLMSAKDEQESVSNLLTSAQSRLEILDDMEQKVVTLEAENAELRQAASQAQRESEALQREVAEMDVLKAQNRELTQYVESMESSRKQYEDDAQRYRNQYEKSEKESETLRFKLGDIEKKWIEMERQEQEARQADPTLDPAPPPLGLDAPQGEPDDLTEIVGVGKVFEATLHDLGVYHYRQIAAFGPAEIARINSELQEFKGRIEHDDWIGQAKELHFKKYEDADE